MTIFDGVGPELYRENAFRITGLAVDATPRDIRRRAERLRVMAQVGVNADVEPRALPPPRAPDETATQGAMQRLRSPESRLVDEFFWFWPVADGVPDEAMTALRRGDPDTAERTWRSLRSRGAKAPGMDNLLSALRSDPGTAGPVVPASAGAVAAHNLAVLAHARALDADGLDERGRTQWRRAFEHWREVISDDAFWDLLESRVRRLDDPRLTPVTARVMRALLPETLLSINARLAVRAFRDGRRPDADGHVALMRASGFDETMIDDALRGAVEPDTARIRAICEDAERSVDAEPASGDETAARLLGQAAPLLAVLAFALPARHPVLQGAKDEVALRVLRCVVPFVNQTDRWGTAIDLLERALPLAATPTALGRLEENLATARVQVQYHTCWFCKANPADDACVVERKMHGDIERAVVGVSYNAQQIRTTWRTATVKVPRCETCRSAHRRRHSAGWGLGCGGAVLLLVLAILSFVNGVVPVGIGLLVAGVIAALWGGGTTADGLTAGEAASLREFEPIKGQLALGWAFGEKPPGVN